MVWWADKAGAAMTMYSKDYVEGSLLESAPQEKLCDWADTV